MHEFVFQREKKLSRVPNKNFNDKNFLTLTLVYFFKLLSAADSLSYVLLLSSLYVFFKSILKYLRTKSFCCLSEMLFNVIIYDVFTSICKIVNIYINTTYKMCIL